jgi:HPr kinase/phosphorylase
MRLHASSAARPGPDGYDALLIIGPSGAGKSDFLLRLIHQNFLLLADDQVEIDAANMARPPAALAGMLEVRGLGIFRLPYIETAPLRLVIQLGVQTIRLPFPKIHPETKLPLVTIDPAAAAAAARAMIALDAACGRVTQLAGAFAA